MVASQKDYNNFLANSQGVRYTITEACDFMQTIDKYFPFSVTNPIQWVKANTNEPVSIGYNSSPEKIIHLRELKEKQINGFRKGKAPIKLLIKRFK